MKKLPIGVQSFGLMIGEDYLYVDKTRDIHKLFANGGKYYFLSRPRRFGKSLLISTLEEIFSGNRELFKGLWIYDNIEWEKYPVVHIDLSLLKYDTPRQLEESLNRLMEDVGNGYSITLDPERYSNEKFRQLIEKLAAKNQVVILVDEYDKPIIDKIGREEIVSKNRDILRDFFSVVKASDKFVKFAFFTGVSKFSKVSVFSGLNNLRDITLSEGFSTLLGYTEDEMDRYFSPFMEHMSSTLGMNKKELSDKIRKWYNGYSWDGKHFVYNPFSILSFFSENAFANYWFTTGTPTFLTKLIKSKKSDITGFDDVVVGSYVFDSYDIDRVEIVALLFQTGYLTVKEKFLKKDQLRYRLSYPNREVRDSFLAHLLQEYTQKDLAVGMQLLDRLSDAIEGNDIDGFIRVLKSLFASIPYNIFIGEREAYYHTIIYLIMKLSGAAVQPEVQTNIGRIDAVLETNNRIYIMEYKMGSETDALMQVKENKYYEKFLSAGKEIVLIGIGFNVAERNIGNYIIEVVSSP